MNRDGVALLMVGDELLDGRTPDTNSHWLIEQLSARNWTVTGVETLGDDAHAIAGALHRRTGAVGAVIVTGGLGPTPDDRTRDALAMLAGEELAEDPELVAQITALLESRGRTMSDANRRQAVRPESSLPLRNGVGTAPGLWHEIDGTAVILLPGVPAELRWMFEHEVRPRLAAHLVASDTHTRRLRTTGVAEARLAEIVRDALGDDHHDGLAWCVASYGVDVLVRDDDTARLDDVTARLRTAFGENLFAEGTVDLPEVVVRRLTERGETVAVAESCTGGLVGAALTSVPGSSRVLLGGVIAYANAVKQEQLGVDVALIEEHGAVSDVVARAMAEGVRARLGSTYGVSTTGVAGPGGGTEDKPVGTVWIGFADAEGAVARLRRLGGDRSLVRHWSVAATLDAIRRGRRAFADRNAGTR